MGSYYRTITPNTLNNGSYSWTIDENYTSYGDAYQIRIEDAYNCSNYDISEAYF
ncbi:MAG: hypothetical protein JW891_04680 [Candidatus Lokiarchaeota archaeon]|nr:hypothetical protein [Candidatus Lokiarchaeota archaeon]